MCVARSREASRTAYPAHVPWRSRASSAVGANAMPASNVMCAITHRVRRCARFRASAAPSLTLAATVRTAGSPGSMIALAAGDSGPTGSLAASLAAPSAETPT